MITGEDVAHITRVLRLTPGNRITVTAGEGRDYQVELTEVQKNAVLGRIIQSMEVNREPALEVVLVQGLPKGDKMDLIVQKCTELGVSRVVPVETRRAVVRLDQLKAVQRTARWQKIARESSKQCLRSRIPEVTPVTGWTEALALVPSGALALVPWEEETGQGLKALLNGWDGVKPNEVWIFIGPEGGLDPEEVAAACAAGVLPVTLGPRILRTETAGQAALTMLLYHWGDLGGSG